MAKAVMRPAIVKRPIPRCAILGLASALVSRAGAVPCAIVHARY